MKTIKDNNKELKQKIKKLELLSPKTDTRIYYGYQLYPIQEKMNEIIDFLNQGIKRESPKNERVFEKAREKFWNLTAKLDGNKKKETDINKLVNRRKLNKLIAKVLKGCS